MKPDIIQAISALVGGKFSTKADGTIVYHDGQTPPTQKEIDDKIDELVAVWETEEYARNRAKDYPDTGEQFNKIYDDGIDKWKSEMVDPVKAKWPKDNSGPK